ncbi:hypothetical protein [Tahibacter amnicola]|uniref:Uncharacterized protein n=1 Tax=Tahibacter amnicola TaxID=2976241 RepID=A0ABY6B7F7_9GAMM|nr:hypothetical protein [Tahibacter amnicola]UXI66038.1 hypothetical protein N4264_14895 [Tahibacter amnicola]
MKNTFIIEKWTRLLHWFRSQQNKPTSDSAIWRENNAPAPPKAASATGIRPRRGVRVS